MDTFILYFAAAGMVTGAILFLFGFGLLIHAIWPRDGNPKPSGKIADATEVPPGAETQ